MIIPRPEIRNQFEIAALYIFTAFLSLRVAQNLSAVASVGQASAPSPLITVSAAIISLSAVLYLYRKGLSSIAEIWIGITYLVFGFVALDMFLPTMAAIPSAFVLVAASFSNRCGMSNLARAVPFAGAAAAIGVLNSFVSAGALLVLYAVLDAYFSKNLMESAGEASEEIELPSFSNQSISLGAADVIVPSVFAVSTLQYGINVATVTAVSPVLALGIVLYKENNFRALVPLLAAASFFGFAVGLFVF